MDESEEVRRIKVRFEFMHISDIDNRLLSYRNVVDFVMLQHYRVVLGTGYTACSPHPANILDQQRLSA